MLKSRGFVYFDIFEKPHACLPTLGSRAFFVYFCVPVPYHKDKIYTGIYTGSTVLPVSSSYRWDLLCPTRLDHKKVSATFSPAEMAPQDPASPDAYDAARMTSSHYKYLATAYRILVRSPLGLFWDTVLTAASGGVRMCLKKKETKKKRGNGTRSPLFFRAYSSRGP